MDFILNEDQRMLRDTVRRIAEEKFAPIAAKAGPRSPRSETACSGVPFQALIRTSVLPPLAR